METKHNPLGLIQAISVAILAGLAAALLSGGLLPSVNGQFFLLFMLAPLPLILAGYGWHSLVSLLGALMGGLCINLFTGERAALGFLGLVGLPAWNLASFSIHFFTPVAGRTLFPQGLALGWLYFLAMMYICLLIVGAAIAVEPDFMVMSAKIAGFVRQAAEIMLGVEGGALPPGFTLASYNRLIDMMAGMLLPVSGVVCLLSVVMSGALGVSIAAKAGFLPFLRPDLRHFQMPGGTIILFVATMLLSTREGYSGLFGLLTTVGFALGFTFQGLAVMHVRSIGMNGRLPLLILGWSLLIIFGFPGVIFLALGLADHLMNLRKNRLP